MAFDFIRQSWVGLFCTLVVRYFSVSDLYLRNPQKNFLNLETVVKSLNFKSVSQRSMPHLEVKSNR